MIFFEALSSEVCMCMLYLKWVMNCVCHISEIYELLQLAQENRHYISLRIYNYAAFGMVPEKDGLDNEKFSEIIDFVKSCEVS